MMRPRASKLKARRLAPAASLTARMPPGTAGSYSTVAWTRAPTPSLVRRPSALNSRYCFEVESTSRQPPPASGERIMSRST